MPVLASWHGHKKWPPAKQLIPTEIYSLTVVWDQGVGRLHSLWRPTGVSLLISSSFRWLQPLLPQTFLLAIATSVTSQWLVSGSYPWDTLPRSSGPGFGVLAMCLYSSVTCSISLCPCAMRAGAMFFFFLIILSLMPSAVSSIRQVLNKHFFCSEWSNKKKKKGRKEGQMEDIVFPLC